MHASKEFTQPRIRIHPWLANSPDAVLAGQHMCGGLRFVVWHIVSDMECLSNDCGWPHFNNLHPCIFDSVSTEQGSDYPMTDLSRDANWLDTLLSDDELIHISPTNSPLQFFARPDPFSHSRRINACGLPRHCAIFDWFYFFGIGSFLSVCRRQSSADGSIVERNSTALRCHVYPFPFI